ncbi:hypothetical protein CPB83DRAFT_626873 [Crepidotus variabilis]|uniref:NACHT domain-containing protein n=1 Tax=Crepidotus variabilis TaxID=179855 RepID=A0A9P6EPX7_9AGAR|nr:hypothetical protein CPB83DRAFT_626873 [Crepidotus variabilis]
MDQPTMNFLSDLLARLYRHCAPGAFLTSAERQNPPRCSPRTRVKLLIEIKGFTEGGGLSAAAMWLTGSAGSGKTALAQSVAEQLKQDGLVLGCHFFFRTSKDGKRSDGHLWVPSLVHQMVRGLPETLPLVERTIRLNASVFDQRLDDVLHDLFLQPLLMASTEVQVFSFRRFLEWLVGMRKYIKGHPRLIVVDGLDECSSMDTQKDIIKAIASVIPKLRIPIRFLIASRPETHIRTTIDREFKKINIHRINLDQDQDVRKDLEEYFNDRCTDLRLHHPALKGQQAYLDWPSRSDIDILITKSSTQFIFASTVMNYISHPRGHPVKRLKVVLGILNTPQQDRPFLTLDTLYKVILLTVDDVDRYAVRLILTFIYLAGKGKTASPYLKLETSPEYLERLLGLDVGDVPLLLDPLVSLLTLPELPTGSIIMSHASFFDFFCDSTRSEEVTILLEDAHEVIAKQLFDETEKTDSWYGSSALNTSRLNSLLYHALQARLSDELVLKLCVLQDNMTYTIFFMTSHQTTELNTLRAQINQLCNLLRPRLEGMTETQISPFDQSNELERRQHQGEAAFLILNLTRNANDYNLMMNHLRSGLGEWSTASKLSGRLTIHLCLQSIRELVGKRGDSARRLDFVQLLEDPTRFDCISISWQREFAVEVVALLQSMRATRPSNNGVRIPREWLDNLIVKWSQVAIKE